MERSLKVLMITSETSWRGGETQIELLMKGLSSERYDLVLAAPPGSPIAERAKEMGFEVFLLAITGGLDLVAAGRLRSYLKRKRFDIIHSHSSHAHSIAFLATRKMRDRPRLVVSRRVAFPIARNPFSRLKYLRGADHYVAISYGVQEILIAGGVRESRIDVVQSGVDLGKVGQPYDGSRIRREFSLQEDDIVVGNIAAMVPNKAQGDFIKAAKVVAGKFLQSKFVITGEGRLYASLQALCRDLGLQSRVIFTGFRKDPLAILSVLDCFVMSSLHEGLCTSIMDAQAMRIPVVATRTGGIPELIEDGVTGMLVPPGRPAELANAIIRMLSDEGLRARCIDNAKKQSRNYDFSLMAGKTGEVYRKLIR
jgi:glycosyltransferase involved in cell wall biosynthesis